MGSKDAPPDHDREPTSKPSEEAGADASGEGEAPEASAAEEAPADAPTPQEAVEEAIRESSVPPPPPPPPPRGAAWAEPIARFERRWTWLETRLITFVLLWQLVALVAWVLLSGLASPVGAGSSAGTVFRALVGAVALGSAAWFWGRRLEGWRRQAAALGAIALGIAVAPLWRGAGVGYFDNLRSWLQEGSLLTLMGGLRGLGTRLTLWLALLGGSLATAAGKHIHIDLLFRILPKRLRVPAAVLNAAAAAAVCFAAVWGFVDHIAIESFGSRADDAPAAKIQRVQHHVGEHAFLAWKQLGLDLRTLPQVVMGGRYDQWMSASEWNAWVKGAGLEARYPEADIQNYLVPDDAGPHLPLVVSPDGEPTRGMLAHDLSLVFPFGLLMIGIRFLLRVLLTLSGHISVDPDEAHKEEIRGAAATTQPTPVEPREGRA